MNGESSPSPREERAGRGSGWAAGDPMLAHISNLTKWILLSPALSSLGGRRGRNSVPPQVHWLHAAPLWRCDSPYVGCHHCEQELRAPKNYSILARHSRLLSTA